MFVIFHQFGRGLVVILDVVDNGFVELVDFVELFYGFFIIFL